MTESDLDLIAVDLPGLQGVIGPIIADLRLPAGSVIILITREKDLVVPKGATHLQGWDQVTVLVHARDQESVRSVLLSALVG